MSPGKVRFFKPCISVELCGLRCYQTWPGKAAWEIHHKWLSKWRKYGKIERNMGTFHIVPLQMDI